MKRKAIAQHGPPKTKSIGYKGERHKNFHPTGLYLNLFFISGDSNIGLFGIEELLCLILDYVGPFSFTSRTVWCFQSNERDERQTNVLSIHSTELGAMIAALKAFTHENDELMLIENPSSREKILAAFVSRHLQVDKQTDDILACYTDGTLSEAEVRRTWRPLKNGKTHSCERVPVGWRLKKRNYSNEL